jgi:acyl carrier protein
MRHEIENRLKNCFRIVFPDLPDEQIASASQDTVSTWDSLATVTLVSMIDEEFGIELNLDRLGDFDSFSHICSYVRNEAGS